MKNLEIKVKVEEIDKIKARLDFATFHATLEQVDTYYLLGEKRIKMREERARSEIILYTRKLQNGTKESTYRRITIPQKFVNLSKRSLNFLYGTKVMVRKERDLYVYKNTRIHIDTVVNLGTFIELETVIQNVEEHEKYVEEHEEVKLILSLAAYPTIAGSYSDLCK